MRYFLLAIAVLTFASCTKSQDNNIVDTRFTYVNTTDYIIDVNVYVKKQELVNFRYTVMPKDSLSLDFKSLSSPANPFGAPEVDSAEVVFDTAKRLIYTLEGPNGKQKSRNIFYLSSPAYVRQAHDTKAYCYRYEFTNTDYFNAR